MGWGPRGRGRKGGRRPKPPSESSGGGVVRLRFLCGPPDEPERAEDRNLQHDEEEEDRQEPVHRPQSRPLAHTVNASTWTSSSPSSDSVGTSSVGSSRAPRPLVAALVEAVVDPGKRPAPAVLVERAELPVGGAEPGGAVEADVGKLGEAEDVGEVVVRFFLPAGGPDEVVEPGQPLQPLAGGDRDAVDHPVDELEPGLLAARRLIESEQRDHPVDINSKDRFAHTWNLEDTHGLMAASRWPLAEVWRRAWNPSRTGGYSKRRPD